MAARFIRRHVGEMVRSYKQSVRVLATAFAVILMAAGCDRMVTPRGKQLLRDADAKATEGDFMQAINLYEQTLDGSTGSAEVHYKLGLLYDDKMADPLNAVHHFKRYLSLAPAGRRALDVKGFIQRDEVALLTSSSGDSIVTRAEAARLRNENLALRKELEEQRAKAHTATADASQPGTKKTTSRKRRSTPTTH